MSGSAPGYWKNETSGVLRDAMEWYLCGDRLHRSDHVAAIRAYFRQWIGADYWLVTDEIVTLRADVDGLITRGRIDAWLGRAIEQGIDPL